MTKNAKASEQTDKWVKKNYPLSKKILANWSANKFLSGKQAERAVKIL